MKEQYDAKYRLGTLAHIAKLWAESPSLRLGQLLMNLTRKDWDTDSQAQSRLWNEENWESYELEPVQKWRDALGYDEGKACRVKITKENQSAEDWMEGCIFHGMTHFGNFIAERSDGEVFAFEQCQILEPCQGEEVKAVCDGCEAELKDGEYCDNIDCKLFWKATKEPQTLQQRIEEQFEGKIVKMLDKDDEGFILIDGMYTHAQAPSLKGFAGFVYTRGRTGQRLAHNAAPVNKVDGKYQFPVAILFEADK